MFYDDLTRRLNEEIRQQQSVIEGSFLKAGIPKNELNNLHSYKFSRNELMSLFSFISRKSLVGDINDSKVFLIDEMTLDSLHNVKHENINYERSIKLPFPKIFFEFKSPITFELMSGGKIDALGAFYAAASDTNKGFTNFARNYFPNMKESGSVPTRFVAAFFDKEASFSKDETGRVDLMFTTDTLPNFSFMAEKRLYEIDYRNNKIQRTQLETLVDAESGEEDVTQVVNKEVLSGAKKKIDLALNLINYINAQNVVILREDREKHSPSELARINRRRLNDGKKPIAFLKPYYLIEIKKSYVRNEEEHPPSWSLNYRFWVRGHFRHYQDGTCIWIKEYIKGPQDTPLKPNRWEMKHKNFKNLLEGKVNERV
jgi:hypothetical protein